MATSPWFLALLPPLAAFAGLSSASSAQTPPNVLILFADDVSPYDLSVYTSDTDPNAAKVLRIEGDLKQNGVLFTTAWADPTCSPTRAMIQTGRYGWRTGIGIEIEETNNGVGLPSTELILPAMLDRYAPDAWSHAAIGKWHLSAVDYGECPPSKPPSAPDVLGYSYFAGQIFSVSPGSLYCDPMDGTTWSPWSTWVSSPGVDARKDPALSGDVLVRKQAQDAIDWIAQQGGGPWLCYVAFQAPFELYRAPEANTYSTAVVTVPCEDCSPAGENRNCFLAYMESLDDQVGRILDAITSMQGGQSWTDTTTVFFLSDNGTPVDVVNPTIGQGQHKGTTLEGGLAVPFVVSGASVPPACRGTVSPALVDAVDLFATVASIAGVDLGSAPGLPQLDSVDLLPVLADPLLQDPSTPRRAFLYAEQFPQNVAPETLPVLYGSKNVRAARDARYKYVFHPTGGPGVAPLYYASSGHREGDEFYDLEVAEDPESNLNGPRPIDETLHPGGEAAREALLKDIQELLGVQ